MPDRPLLPLPKPENSSPPQGNAPRSNLQTPRKEQQIARIDPVFERLRSLLEDSPNRIIEVRKDPTALAPDRVIVFEIAGTVDKFTNALLRVPGFTFLAEQEVNQAADDDFANLDTRVGHEGQRRIDQAVNGRLYLAMPNIAALRDLLSLWRRWRSGQPLAFGLAPFSHLFQQLREVRPWGPADRIPDDTIDYWREEITQNPGRLVRTEVEFWFQTDAGRRNRAAQEFETMVRAVNGEIIRNVVIQDIRYHGALIDLPVGEIATLIERSNIRFALADDVMFYQPQSLLRSPAVPADANPAPPVLEQTVPSGTPIAALLDGVPIQTHRYLTNKLMLDDPDGLEAQAIVSRRYHGTAMASLIIHGDLNAPTAPISRPLYVRPIMSPNQWDSEETSKDYLLLDTIHRAVLRIKGTQAEAGVAPDVFLINLSIGDPRRPFSGSVSPLARLLDYLSNRYGILFLVSGGNVTETIDISGFENWTAYSSAKPDERQKATLEALNAQKHLRTILSPAESLNSLTIGAQHHDNMTARQLTFNIVDPFDSNTLPNISSGLGLGPNRTVKPDIYMPGGREHVQSRSSGDGVNTVSPPSSRRVSGILAAAPDPSGQARLDYLALIDGTSTATALATRAAHRIFESLVDEDGYLSQMDARFYAVVMKALLVHRARWSEVSDVLKEVCGPSDRGKHVEQAENVSRFIGFGVPNIDEAIECSANRATLIGYGSLEINKAHRYRIPLPACLERVTDPRSLTLTLAWFSPINPTLKSYRAVKLEVAPATPKVSFGVKRASRQPQDPTVRRGTVFHEHYEGNAAVPYIDDGHLILDVWCKSDTGIRDTSIRYGIAVTIEAGTALPVYEEIKDLLRVSLRS